MKRALLLVFTVTLLGAASAWYILQEQPQSESVQTSVTETEAVKAASEEIVSEEVNYFEDKRGYFVRPTAAGAYPGVVMIHENRGLRPEIRTAAERLASEGYQVLAVDLYGVVMETQEEARAFSPTYDAEKGIENLKAAAAYLREQGAPKLASLGWCFGGAQSLALSTSGEDLDATVIYYGRLTEDRDVLSKLNAPVLGIFGDQDQAISTSSVAQFEATLTELNVPTEIHMYPGVGHAFANPSNPNHAPEETADAWQQTLAFLEKTIR